MFGYGRRKYAQGFKDGSVRGFADAMESSHCRRLKFEEIELANYIGKPVIVVGNEWEDPVIGFGVSIEHITRSRVPRLVIRDYVRNRTSISHAQVKPFTDQLYSAIKRLDPYERWIVTSSSAGSFTDIDKPKLESICTPEQLDEKLKKHGFFHDLKKFRDSYIIEGMSSSG